MKCPRCGVDVTPQSCEVGLVRAACACEAAREKCTRKKCKCQVVQAELSPDGADVVAWWCGVHAHVEAFDETPAAPVAAPEPEPPEAVEPPTDPDSRVGMVIEEHVWQDTKKLAEADLKTQKYNVVCLGCHKVHPYAGRKLVRSEIGFRTICPNPKCEQCPRFQILES